MKKKESPYKREAIGASLKRWSATDISSAVSNRNNTEIDSKFTVDSLRCLPTLSGQVKRVFLFDLITEINELKRHQFPDGDRPK